MLILRIGDKLIDCLAWAVSLLLRQPLIYFAKALLGRVQWYAARRCFGSIGKWGMIEAPFSLQNPENVVIGDHFSARSGFLLETIDRYEEDRFNPKVIIGDHVSFYRDCHIGCINRIEIGNNVLFGSRVYISDHFHGDTSGKHLDQPPVLRKLTSKGPVIIGNNAWVGDGVAIMPGVTIGENAIIGANSVVTKDIPKNCVAAGVPASVIKRWE